MPSLILSIARGGGAVAAPLSLGAGANGEVANSQQTLFLRHDQNERITGVGFFITAFAGSYTGVANAKADLNEIRSWGDATVVDNFGGVQINQDALGGFPPTSWPIAASHTRGNGAVFNGTQGNSSLNTIPLQVSSGAPAIGVIPANMAGVAPDISVRFRVQIPRSVTLAGVRLYTLNLVYTFTS